MEHDEVFVPANREEAKPYMPVTKFKTMMNIILTLLLGWPLYLLFNVTGNKSHGDKHVDHFNPNVSIIILLGVANVFVQSPIFKPKDRADIVLSDIVLAFVLLTLAYCST